MVFFVKNSINRVIYKKIKGSRGNVYKVISRLESS